jgi:branched-chain amino acid transport system ATP-binding protein
MSLLRVRNLVKKFGGLTALDKLSFELDEKTILGVMGPNGSGKTTLLNCLNMVYQPDEGEIYLRDKLINGMRPHEVTRLGVGRTFQVPRIFSQLTVLANVLVSLLYSSASLDELKVKAQNLLDFVGILHLKDNLGYELSGGQQKLLEFARVLMSDPDLFLLDEPFAGVHPVIQTELSGKIRELNEKGKTFIIVSHDIAALSRLCERVIVLNSGRKIADGPLQEVQKNEEVLEAYLGV